MAISSVQPPTLIPYEPTRDREFVRSTLALLLIGLVILETGAFGYMGYSVITKQPPAGEMDKSIAAIKDIAAILLTPSIALASAVMGFYYASKGDNS